MLIFRLGSDIVAAVLMTCGDNAAAAATLLLLLLLLLRAVGMDDCFNDVLLNAATSLDMRMMVVSVLTERCDHTVL